ncbi:hypothetical protein FRC15_010719 [Serendipita sp. 397]|nr:hypothetical protein FRC15_010719 [Serendipita sp. 397]
MSILYARQPEECDFCLTRNLPEWFGCRACPKRVCMSCTNTYSREVHTHEHGPHHQFSLIRLPRFCRGCKKEITRNFLMCGKCTDDNGMLSFTVCITCYIDTPTARRHASSRGNHTFVHVEIEPSYPPKTIEIVSVPPQEAYDSWSCVICKQNNLKTNGALVCLECTGFDVCPKCADERHVTRHARTRKHHFVFYLISIVNGDNTAAGSSAIHRVTTPSLSLNEGGTRNQISVGPLVPFGDTQGETAIDEPPPPYRR